MLIVIHVIAIIITLRASASPVIVERIILHLRGWAYQNDMVILMMAYLTKIAYFLLFGIGALRAGFAFLILVLNGEEH